MSTMDSVKPAATRENVVALLVSLCMAATGATRSANTEFAVELLPTPVLPDQAHSARGTVRTRALYLC